VSDDDNEKRSFGDTELGQCLGCGFLILALAAALGGCHILEEWHPFAQQPVLERTNNPVTR